MLSVLKGLSVGDIVKHINVFWCEQSDTDLVNQTKGAW